jgi:hypothetical protein
VPAGVVYQTIEASPAGDGGLDQVVNLFDFGNVTADEVCPAWAGGVDFAGEGGGWFFFSCAEDYVSPGVTKVRTQPSPIPLLPPVMITTLST